MYTYISGQVYSLTSEKRLMEQTNNNMLQLTQFLRQQNASDLTVHFRLIHEWWGRTRVPHVQSYYIALHTAGILRLQVKEIHVHLVVRPPLSDRFVDSLVDLTVRLPYGLVSPKKR